MNGPIPGMDTLASARLRVPAMERWTYLDVAGRCPLSRATRAALDAHLDERMVNGANKEKFFVGPKHQMWTGLTSCVPRYFPSPRPRP